MRLELSRVIDAFLSDRVLRVQPHVIKRAVRTLMRSDHEIEALALIRGAYPGDGDSYASLEDARAILKAIMLEPVPRWTHS